MPRDPLTRLRQAVVDRTFVPLVGAGVGAATANMPLWRELLEHGIAYARQNKSQIGASPQRLSAIKRLAETDLLGALSSLQGVLSPNTDEHWTSVHYKRWLETTFAHSEQNGLVSREIIERLGDLNPRIIVTTNYDLLLETYVKPNATSVTWLTPVRMRELLRAGDGVIHLHGRYDQPQSVILSHSDYQRLIDDAVARRVTSSLFDAGIVVFIGASPTGVADPHLARVLRHFSELRDERLDELEPHILLHYGSLSPEERVTLRDLGIEPFSYGAGPTELPAFLASLASHNHAQVSVTDVERIAESIVFAQDLGAAARATVDAIRTWVYPTQAIRVGFAEYSGSADPDVPTELVEDFTYPTDDPCTYHYPLSIAGWALAEGRVIAWPVDQTRTCDLERLRKLGRLDEVRKQIITETKRPDSPLRVYLDLDRIPARFDAGRLMLRDVFQDWTNTPRQTIFTQFVSVPVPRLTNRSTTRKGVPPAGVINIDQADPTPSLASPATIGKLNVLSDLLWSLWQRVAKGPGLG